MGVYIKHLQAEKVKTLFMMLGLHIKDGDIVEVTKPHGRIIDESEIKTVYGREVPKRNNGYTIVIQRIDFTDAPTVIEAEDE